MFSAIQESIKQALDEKGYTYKGGKSLRDTILDTLTDPNSSFNFAGAFNKYKEKFTEYASPEGVIRDLRELDIEGSWICCNVLWKLQTEKGSTGHALLKIL